MDVLAELATEILRRPPRLGQTRLVCVDGRSGVGKTLFAQRLAAAVMEGGGGRLPVPVVHTDDLLDGWRDQFTFWPRLVAAVLGPLGEGRPGRYRAYDWHGGAFGDVEIDVPPAPVVILEGVSAARAAARPLATLTIFLTAPRETRLARSIARDGDEAQAHLESWRRGEDRHFAADATAAHADLIISTAGGDDGGGGHADAAVHAGEYLLLHPDASAGP
jgi:uridine kinase